MSLTQRHKIEPLDFASELPPCYYQTYDDVKQEAPQAFLRAIVTSFVANGDCVAGL